MGIEGFPSAPPWLPITHIVGTKRRCKKINTQARATILWKLGLADAAKKKNEPKKAYDKQAGGKMPCTKCNKSLNQAADLRATFFRWNL